MANALAASMAGLSMHSHCRANTPRPTPSFGFSCSMRGRGLSIRGTYRCLPSSSRGFLTIVAAQNAKQRQRLSEKQRVYNKDRKSAVATRVKKVLKALEGFSGKVELEDELSSIEKTMSEVLKALDRFGGKMESEEELKPVEKMMSEAYQEIDKAVVKGIIKQETAGRRKSRMAVAKKKLLIDAGLYTPTTQTA